MVKKYLLAFLCVTILSLFVSLPVSAAENDFSNASFTGSGFNWHSGPALSPSAPSGFSHYLIIYSNPATWFTGDTEYAAYYSINDYITSINLRIDDGGCTLITTTPTSATPYSAYVRTRSYRYSSTAQDGYTLGNDSESSIGTVNRSFSSSQSKRVCIITDLPCFDQNGDPVGNVDTLPHFFFNYFMDGSGVFHHRLGSSVVSDTSDITVTWYVVNGSVNTPTGSVYDTFSTNVLTDEYVHTNMSGFDYFRAAYDEYRRVTGGALGQFIADYQGIGEITRKKYEYYYVPVTSVAVERVPAFDYTDYYPAINLKSETYDIHKGAYCQLDMNKWRQNLNKGFIYDLNHIAVIAVVTDGRTTKIYRHDFLVSDCFANMDSNISDGDVPQETTPTPSNVSDFQSLADYLKNVFNNINNNNVINNANLVNNLTSFPWANVVNAGVGGALADFLPNLSSEFDTMFSGIFDEFTVPSQEQIDEIEDEIQAEQDDLHDKLAFVEDVKTEIYFVSSSIAAAGSSEPYFKQKLVYYVPAFNEQDGSYYFTFDETEDEITFFRGAWVDVNTREALKDLITVFASLAVLLHIWHTLPSTVGNMPVSRGGD